MKKRIFSFLLAFILCLGLMPMGALAEADAPAMDEVPAAEADAPAEVMLPDDLPAEGEVPDLPGEDAADAPPAPEAVPEDISEEPDGADTVTAPAAGVQSGSCGDDLTWSLDNGTLLISGTGEMDNYELQSTAPWFSERESITFVMILSGVTSIGDYAFIACSELEAISIPTTVDAVGEFAFAECHSLRHVQLPSGITEIRSGTFARCLGLTRVDIPTTVTTIDENAFSVCDSLVSITIPSGVTTIRAQAFSDCDALENVTLSEGLLTIGQEAFQGCDRLARITIPTSVTAIGAGAFSECAIFSDITFQGAPPAVAANTFQGVSALTIYFHSSAGGWTSNAKELFSSAGAGSVVWGDLDAEGLCGDNVRWKVSNGVLSIIGTGPMYDYGQTTDPAPWEADRANITSIAISDGVTAIGSHAFYGCSQAATVSVPASVQAIGAGAFYRCSLLGAITVPAGVTAIENDVFRNCVNLKVISLPASVTTIGSKSFYSCSGLTEIELPSGLVSIGDQAFSACGKLTSVTFSMLLESLGGRAFEYCYALKSITFYGDAPAVASGVFSGVTATARYPSSAAGWTDSFKASCGSGLTWEELPAYCGSMVTWRLDRDGRLVITGYGATYDFADEPAPWADRAERITSVVLQTGVSAIGANAFAGCENLKSVTFISSLDTIGSSAFAGCSALEAVTFPANVASIGARAFAGCSALDELTFLGDAPAIDDTAFLGVTAAVTINSGTAGWTTAMKNYSGELRWTGVLKDKATGATVTAPAADLGQAVSLEITACTVETPTWPDSMRMRAYASYDISLVNEKHETVQLAENKTVTVSLAVPMGYAASRCHVYHVEGDRLTDVNAVPSTDGDRLVFAASGFSVYIIAQELERNLAWGDANADGTCTIKDASVMMQAVVGLYELQGDRKTASDLDRDGEITLTDALWAACLAMEKITTGELGLPISPPLSSVIG